MSDDDEVRITLRLPAALRLRLAKAAERHERSMNGEIVSRLDSHDEVVSKLEETEAALTKREEQLYEDRVRLRRMQKSFDELAPTIRRVAELEQEKFAADKRLHNVQSSLPQDQTLYVALDANGYPTSWPEIYAHLSQLAEIAGFNPTHMEARVFDAELVRMSEREAQWLQLRDHYHNLREAASKVMPREYIAKLNLLGEASDSHDPFLVVNEALEKGDIERVKDELSRLVKGLVTYGRAFEMSVEGNAKRAEELLDMAIAEVEGKNENDDEQGAA